MLLALFAVLLIVWLLGASSSKSPGAMIHLLLILAVIALIAHFLRH